MKVERPATGRVVGVGDPARPERAVHQLVVTDDGLADPTQDRRLGERRVPRRDGAPVGRIRDRAGTHGWTLVRRAPPRADPARRRRPAPRRCRSCRAGAARTSIRASVGYADPDGAAVRDHQHRLARVRVGDLPEHAGEPVGDLAAALAPGTRSSRWPASHRPYVSANGSSSSGTPRCSPTSNSRRPSRVVTPTPSRAATISPVCTARASVEVHTWDTRREASDSASSAAWRRPRRVSEPPSSAQVGASYSASPCRATTKVVAHWRAVTRPTVRRPGRPPRRAPRRSPCCRARPARPPSGTAAGGRCAPCRRARRRGRSGPDGPR